MKELPAPDGVFIGGSGGHLKEILELVEKKNPKARVVINAISLETLQEAMEWVKNGNVIDEEVLQISVNKSRKIGSYHMMMGQNPIYIISFQLNEKEETK